MDDVSTGNKSMIFGQLVSVARLFAQFRLQFYAGTKKFLQNFWLPLLKHSIKFGQMNSADLGKISRNPSSSE